MHVMVFYFPLSYKTIENVVHNHTETMQAIHSALRVCPFTLRGISGVIP